MQRLGKYLKYIVTASPILSAVGCMIYTSINQDTSDHVYIVMIFGLLTFISTSFMVDQLLQEKKWENLEKKWLTKIDSISDGSIRKYEDTVEWVEAIDELIADGKRHTIEHASLDSTVRGQSPRQRNKVQEHIISVSKNRNIAYKHIVRVRSSNFEHVLERIIAGGKDRDCNFGYIKLPQDFPFCTFEIIDKKYVATRSPFIPGEHPCYMIIQNNVLTDYFESYFQQLWNQAQKINAPSILTDFYDQFSSGYTNELKTKISSKIEKLRDDGIFDDE